MGGKKSALLVRLVSAAGTGFFYVVKKSNGGCRNKSKAGIKRTKGQDNKTKGVPLEFRKYDPRVNRHVLFTEAKMK